MRNDSVSDNSIKGFKKWREYFKELVGNGGERDAGLEVRRERTDVRERKTLHTSENSNNALKEWESLGLIWADG